jgi:aminoglycoside/choline kinase family phosphotransferase
VDIRLLVEEFLGAPAKIESLPGDASTRRYHRVVAGEGARHARMIVMELPADALSSDEVMSGKSPPELPFLNVQRHMKAAGLPVPEIYLDAVARGAVILEDLGDDLFVRRAAGADPATMEAWYGAAVDLMARMHAAMWPVPKGCLAAARAFDYDLLRWELDHYREWGAEAAADRVLDAGVRARLDRAFDGLAAEIAALPRGFVHRDYQSRNLMLRSGEPRAESLCIIDFQDALEGPRVYDLVALLNDSYVEVPADVQGRIIERYARARGIDPGELRAEFDLVTVQRKLKDGGRFVFIDRVRGNPAFLPFVDRSFSRVRAALARLPGHEPLKAALAETDPRRFGG